MQSSLIQNARALETPNDYFSGHTPDEICIPKNIILFSRETAKELQRKSFDSYPHHRFVLLFNLITEGTVAVDGIHWRVRPGEAFLVFPYQFHQFVEIKESSIVWMFLTFELEDPTVMEVFKHRVLKMDTRSYELLERIIDRYRAGKTERLKRRFTLDAASLVNHLREQMALSPRGKAALRRRNSKAPNSLLTRIQKYLAGNLGELHSVSDIAQWISMSESNLRAKFRQQFSISLGSYLRNYRAHQAILLMQNPKMTLTEIAFELGFTTLSAFSRFFSNAVGSSPRAYRKSLQRE